MKVSLNWLRDYVTANLSTDKIVHKLTMAGLEVEKCTTAGGDTVLELEITPNRPDCLCMLGMAREVAAILNKKKKFPTIKKRTAPKRKCPIRIDDKQGCQRYIGTVIEGVHVQRAQESIAKRLGTLGMKPINNIVDITNFCLMETGQPLHAFDFDKLIGGKIIVRKAKAGEKITTLDGIERALDPSIIVIADEKRPVAIAGIMGGQDTEVTASTKNILLESASFDQVMIRRASRKLGLSSESSYRFERGIDLKMVEGGAARAVDLILQNAGGKITRRNDVNYARKKTAGKPISTSVGEINGYIGASLTTAQCKSILTKLDCKVTTAGAGKLKIAPPTFRGDLKGFVDIVEEISRIVGYDNLPSSFPSIQSTDILADARRDIRRSVAQNLIARGLQEVITYTMISRKDLERSGQDGLKSVSIFNPLTQDQEIMRPSLLPSLLSVVQFNNNRGQKDIRCFETGKIYTPKGEIDVLGIVMTGLRRDDWRETAKSGIDFFDIKGALEGALERAYIKAGNINFQPADESFLSRGEAAHILCQSKIFGVIGRIDANVVESWGLKQNDVYFAQLELECLYGHAPKPVKYQPISEWPSIGRDISLAASRSVQAADIENLIRKTAKAHQPVKLTDVRFIELYEGDKIAKDRRGLIFSLTYESRQNRTLRDEEVDAAHQDVLSALTRDLDVIQR